MTTFFLFFKNALFKFPWVAHTALIKFFRFSFHLGNQTKGYDVILDVIVKNKSERSSSHIRSVVGGGGRMERLTGSGVPGGAGWQLQGRREGGDVGEMN